MDTDEELYDLIIQPGVPRSIIRSIVNDYDVEIVERKESINFANMDNDIREVLAFRGTYEVIETVQNVLYKKLQEFIGE